MKDVLVRLVPNMIRPIEALLRNNAGIASSIVFFDEENKKPRGLAFDIAKGRAVLTRPHGSMVNVEVWETPTWRKLAAFAALDVLLT